MIRFLAIVFFLLTVLLLSGKGAFLIAGYNTASKKEKMQYDEKKLCRVMGSGMGVVTIFMVVLAYFGENPPDWLIDSFGVVTIAVVVTMLILCNTICKVKTNVSAEKTEETEKEKRKNSSIKKWSVVASIIIFVIIGVFLVTGEVKITTNDNEIKIEGSYWSDYAVPFESIKSISYIEDFDIGTRTNGWGSFKLNQGSFKNDEFGVYTLYAYTKCDSFIALDTVNRIVVINAETPEETRELYESLEAIVKK